MHLIGSELHPSAALIIWFLAVLAIQSLGYPTLLVLAAAIFLSTPSALKPCWKFIKRGRWLFLSLWLILAYGKAGEALADLPWAPTWEGMAEANLHAVRLLLMLCCLSWLLTRLGHTGLLTAMWGLLRPLPACGIDAERVVVRLALVLENLQSPLPAGAWKRMLAVDSLPGSRPEILHLQLPDWRLSDVLAVLLALLFLLGGVLS